MTTILFLQPTPLLRPTSSRYSLCQLKCNKLAHHPQHTTYKAIPIRRVRPITMPRSDASDGEQLVRAAMIGNLAEVESLLAAGAPAGYASSQNDSGMTALMWAAAEGHVDITKRLLSAGANMNAKTTADQTALLYAFDNLPNINPRPPPPPGFPGQPDRPTPKQIGLGPRTTGHGNVIKLLLAAGADFSVRNNFGETLLHMASRRAQIAWVDVCLAAGIEIDIKSKGYEETALHIAAKEGHEDVVKLLCEKGAFVDARSRFQWTPLIWASACGDENVVRTLVEFNADVNATAQSNQTITTPLKEARKSSNPVGISRLLIAAGAIE